VPEVQHDYGVGRLVNGGMGMALTGSPSRLTAMPPDWPGSMAMVVFIRWSFSIPYSYESESAFKLGVNSPFPVVSVSVIITLKGGDYDDDAPAPDSSSSIMKLATI
jgi:hypothetical protein